MTSSWFPLALAILLLASAPATASSPLESRLQATTLSAQGVQAFQGPLTALLVECRTATPIAPSGFDLHAQQIVAETDRADLALVDSAAKLPPSTSPPATYASAQVTGEATRSLCRLLIFPLDGQPVPILGVASPCSQLTPAGADHTEPRPPRVQNPQARTNLTADLSHSLQWTDCQGANPATGFQDSGLVIQGSFRMALYDWDSVLTTPTQRVALPSGPQSLDPTGTADTSPVAGSATEQFLYVHDGNLRIPATSASILLYVGGATVAAANLALAHADGALASSVVLHSQALQLQGQLTATVVSGATPTSPLDARLGGQVDRAMADGTPLGLSVTKAEGLGTMWLFGAAILPLVVVAFVWRAWLPHRIDRLATKAMEREEAGDFRRALRICNRILKVRPSFVAVRGLRALALTGLGRFDDALEDQAVLHQELSDEPEVTARNAIEASRTCCQLERYDEALAWLGSAYELRPALVSAALATPELAALRDRAWRILGSSEAYA